MKRRHPVIAALLLLVYAAQALVAAGAACPGMNRADHPRELAAAPAAHDGHRHQTSMDSGDHARHGPCHDCCGSGQCFMNHCHALLALPTAPTALLHLPPDRFEVSAAASVPVRPPAAFFRPPTYA